jgi:hypothetical protein
MKLLEIKKEDALKAHQEASSNGKILLENLFGRETFLKPVKERIKCFDDVLAELKINREDFTNSCKGLEPDEIAYRMAKLVARAFNGEEWVPDWTNYNEYKYFPYFTMGSPAGVGFAYYGYDGWRTGSCVGSRLAFKSSDHASYAGKLFEQEIYKPLLTIQQQ